MMGIKKYVLGACLGMSLALVSCGNTPAEETAVTQVTDAAKEEANAQKEVTGAQEASENPSEEKASEDISEEDAATEISAEDAYWLQVMEELNSSYDLTAALTGEALKDLCDPYFSIGVGINGSGMDNQCLNLPEYMAVADKHFNSCTMTNLMKSGYILQQKASQESEDGMPVLSFDTIDPTLQWCMDHGMKMRGHTLVWHAQAPGWFFREGYKDDGAYVDKATMLARMESYIAQMLTHVQENYPGVIYCWDVVNEAVDPDKGDKNSAFSCRMENDGAENPWYMTIGEDYVEMAFTYARKYADPDVKLIYNDFNTYQIPKTKAIFELCSMLKEKGLIDGIGMQGYWGLEYPNLNMIEVAIKKFAELDLEIQITELSISVDEETPEQFEKQGKVYGRVFYTLKSLDQEGGGPANITNVTLFGLIDHYRTGDTTTTRIFDKDYQPKPGFEKIKAVMGQ